MSQLNITPSTIFCRDNLDVLQGINSDCIDLIYLDPPFNKKKIFAAAAGSSAEGAEFRDVFREEDIKDEWGASIECENPELHSYLSGVKVFSSRYNYCYLVYMAVRLIECYRIMKETGSIYLHCDPTMSHYLKIVMDCVFGERNFSNEIVWCYKSGGATKKRFSRKHDIILFYSKSKRFKFNLIKERSYMAEGSGKNPAQTYFEDEHGSYTLVHSKDWWEIGMLATSSKERTGYPTQKPLALLERIIQSSSNEGDIVLDPFCGCATTCIAAEKLGRKWIGVDVSQKAYELVKQRMAEVYPESDGCGKDYGIVLQTIPPMRSGEKKKRLSGNVRIKCGVKARK